MKWQPIETAPKDGWRIQIARFKDDRCLWIATVEWFSMVSVFGKRPKNKVLEGFSLIAPFVLPNDDPERRATNITNYAEFIEMDDCGPTHWKPLPEIIEE